MTEDLAERLPVFVLENVEVRELSSREMTDLRYPIGTFQPEYRLSMERRRQLLSEMAETPGLLRAAVNGLSESQLDIALTGPEGGLCVKWSITWPMRN